jgi:hypothetical protein
MINQIAPIPQQTTRLEGINRGLIQARHIQAKLKETAFEEERPEMGIIWSPVLAVPYLVPITRWIE